MAKLRVEGYSVYLDDADERAKFDFAFAVGTAIMAAEPVCCTLGKASNRKPSTYFVSWWDVECIPFHRKTHFFNDRHSCCAERDRGNNLPCHAR